MKPPTILELAKNTKANGKSPIVYDGTLAVRFADLDPYGHVNASLYLDYVASIRLRYLEEVMKLPVAKVIENGAAFYLKKASLNFRRPVIGMTSVRCLSFIESVEGSTLHIPFTLESSSGSVYCDGKLEYAIVDIKTGGKLDMPDWLAVAFFK